MEPSPTAPCPHCQVPISTEASICPQCRSGVLVDLRLTDAILDGRIRYRLGRALLTIGEGVPPFSVLQNLLTVRGGLVLTGVSRATAQRAQAVFEAERVSVRIQNSGGPPLAPSRSPARLAMIVGLAALMLATVAGAWLALRSHPPGSASDADTPALSQTRVAELGLPATVALSCGDRLGSGFFVDKELLITNAHVLCPGRSTLKVRFSDGREVEGTVVQSEDALDLAVVRASGLRAAPLPLGDAGLLKVGERLTMIGSPVGMEFTVHQGSVSNVDRRDFGVAYIQVDAPVNPGNSGGPLIDDHGRVVGVITMKRLDAEGIGLAVPINYLHTGASPLLPDLAGPRSAGFERMVQRAETDSDKMAVEFSTSEHRPGLIGATASGSWLMIEVLWPSPTEPGARTFTFHFWNGDNRVCSFEGEVGSWLKVEGKDGGSPYPPRIQGWLTRKNLSLDVYVGRARANWGSCPADELNGPIEMEMEGADPSANRAKFS